MTELMTINTLSTAMEIEKDQIKSMALTEK